MEEPHATDHRPHLNPATIHRVQLMVNGLNGAHTLNVQHHAEVDNTPNTELAQILLQLMAVQNVMAMPASVKHATTTHVPSMADGVNGPHMVNAQHHAEMDRK